MLTTWTPYNRIGRPLEAHNARSPEEYRAQQASVIAMNRAARPGRTWRDPVVIDGTARTDLAPTINAGRWLLAVTPHLTCPCGNAPSYDPAWGLACCFECGLTYEHVAPPEGWAEAEALLMRRPRMTNRAWDPRRETLEDLRRENTEHGL